MNGSWHMRYRIEDTGTDLVVHLEGQLNFGADRVFQDLLAELAEHHGHRRVRLDLSELSHIDSVGLGLLYIAREDLDAVGIRLCLSHPRANVLRMLDLTEASETFEISR